MADRPDEQDPEHEVVQPDHPRQPSTGVERCQIRQRAALDEVDEVARLEPGDQGVDDEDAGETAEQRDLEPALVASRGRRCSDELAGSGGRGRPMSRGGVRCRSPSAVSWIELRSSGSIRPRAPTGSPLTVPNDSPTASTIPHTSAPPCGTSGVAPTSSSSQLRRVDHSPPRAEPLSAPDPAFHDAARRDIRRRSFGHPAGCLIGRSVGLAIRERPADRPGDLAGLSFGCGHGRAAR